MKYLYPIRLLLLPLLLLLSFVANAQIYPVQITVQAIPPYPIYLSDFTQGSSDRLRVQLLLTDVNVQNRRVRLKMSINGGGIQLSNPDVVEGALPVNLAGGIPEYLNNEDLKPYFNPQNLPGLNPVAYTQPLPEGVYTICFEAFDFITGQILSKKSCYTLALIQNDPPQLSMPRNGEGVTMQNPQSVLFQWTPRHINATNVSYEFTLLELLDTAINPQAAIQVMQPYYQTTSYSTSLWLGPADAPLTLGRKYVWRVRAKSLSGMDELGVFKNNGYSEAWSFTYTDGFCNAPMGLLATDIAKRSVKVQWMGLPPAFDGSEVSYRISYRSRNGADRWYDRQTTGAELSIFDLDPQTEYEFRVGRLCGSSGYVYGNSVYATTAATTDSNVVTHCGLPPANVDISNQTPLANLQSGETFTAGDFVVTALQVNGAGGSYTGEGFIIVPYLANAKVKVKFNNIFINSERKLAKGFVESTYDPTMKGITDLDGLWEGGSGTGTTVTGNVATNYQTNFPIGSPEDIHVTGSDDNPTITIGNTTNGGGNGLTIHPDSLPVSVADNNGDIYTVEPGVNGSAPVVTKAGEQVPLLMSPAQLNQLASDKGKVTFARSANTKYAFDDYKPEYGASVLWQKEYESLGNEYRVAAKASLPGLPDKIKAIITLSDNTLKPDSVKFVTSKGTRYTGKYLNGNEYEVMLVGSAANDAQELFAVYPLPINTPADSGQFISLGKLLIAGYEPATAKVVVVPVNGGRVDTAAIIAALNSTYNGIGIKWNVQLADAWKDSTWDADHNGKLTVTGSSAWSVYTPEMNALNAAYKAGHTLVNGAAYLFALPQAAEAGVLGDMPRGKRFGYLFSGSNGKTAAHEVGHGLFALKHTFDNAYGFSASAMANNVMSYGSGLELSKLQWDAVHAPGLVIGLFEGDEDGMMEEHGLKIKELLLAIKNSVKKPDFRFEVRKLQEDNSGDITRLGWGTLDLNGDGQEIRLDVEFKNAFDEGEVNLTFDDQSNSFQSVRVGYALNNTFHNEFSLTFLRKEGNDEAFKIITKDLSDYEELLNYLGFSLKESTKQNIIDQYKMALQNANNDCNKLDVLFESIAPFVLEAIPDESLWTALKSISSCSMISSSETDEEKAALNIMRGFKNHKTLYDNLYANSQTVKDLYDGFNGDKCMAYLNILAQLADDYGTPPSVEKYGYIGTVPSGRYQNDPSTPVNEGDWNGKDYFTTVGVSNINGPIAVGTTVGRMNISPFNWGSIQVWGTVNKYRVNNLLDKGILYKDQEKNKDELPVIYIGYLAEKDGDGKLMSAINTGTMMFGFWGSTRVLFAKGVGYLAKAIAFAELSKLALDAYMSNELNRKQVASWGSEGKWIVDNWNTISVTVDLTTLGSQFLLNFVRNGAKVSGQLRVRGNAAEADELDEILKAASAAEEATVLVNEFKNRLAARIANESNMTFRYSESELQSIIKNGKSLNIPDREIEDIIFNGCRNDKAFTATEIISQTNYWNIVKQRGYPNLFNSLNEYEEFSSTLKNLATEWNLPANSIFVQGSTLRVADASKIGDIDIAIKVDAATFENLVTRFRNATTSTGRQNTIINEALRGKITGGNMFLSTTDAGSFKGKIMNALEHKYGVSFSQKYGVSDLQISVIKEGSAIDVAPLLKLK